MRFHDLRHTSATLMVIAGVHLKQMGARLGHADIHTTAKYSHLIRGLDRRGAERLARAIRAGEAEAWRRPRQAYERLSAGTAAQRRPGPRAGSARPGGARAPVPYWYAYW